MRLYEDIYSSILPALMVNIEYLVFEFRIFKGKKVLSAATIKEIEESLWRSHIHHSTGIEGSKLTFQETSMVLTEGKLPPDKSISDKSIEDINAVLDLQRAIDFVSSLVNSERRSIENELREIHKLTVADQADAWPGKYRAGDVKITQSKHTPPAPGDVSDRMYQLGSWIDKNSNQNPIIVAAIAHHELASIHPFRDGNGRVARLLANLILMRGDLPICTIERDERSHYYDALAHADQGDYGTLIQLVLDGVQRSFDDYR